MPVVGGGGPTSAGEAFATLQDLMHLIRAMLDDTDVATANIAASPSGAVRSSNVVTITTTTAHGFQPGEVVVISGVVDASFLGSFLIAQVTSTTIVFNQTAPNASSGGGTASIEGAVFKDSVLLPFVNSAYRKTQRKLAEAGYSFLKGEIEIDVLTGKTQIGDSAAPFLPADFILAHSLYEKGKDTTEKYVKVDKLVGTTLADVDANNQLRVWLWTGDVISLLGATRNITVKLVYEKMLPPMPGTNPASEIMRIRGGIEAVAFRAAGMAARSRGVLALAQDSENNFEMEVRSLINRHAQSEQHRPRRRRGYGYRRRFVYG